MEFLVIILISNVDLNIYEFSTANFRGYSEHSKSPETKNSSHKHEKYAE